MKALKKKGPEKVAFSFLAPQAESAMLAGDFNDWDPTRHPMKKDRKGLWKVSLNLVPGTYQYKFFLDGAWVMDPNCEESVLNPFGSLNCVKKVG